MGQPKLLLIETSQAQASVAVSLDDFYLSADLQPGEHSQKILFEINRLLSLAGLAVCDLDAIACGIGPGAFTSVRLGIAVAQGLAYGADTPLLPIPSLATAMMQCSETSFPIAVAMDARMGEAFIASYQFDPSGEGLQCLLMPQLHTLGDPWPTSNPAEKPAMCTGNLDPAIFNFEHFMFYCPHVDGMTTLARFAFQAGECVSPHNLLPNYCRNRIVKKSG